MALELYEQVPYSTVIATAERDILRAAKLREFLGIEGQSWESALAFRDKVKMKTLLSRANIKVPAFAMLETAVDLYKFIKQHGYPVVVKPVDGMGSRNTAILKNREETIEYLSQGLASNLIVEEFIEGEMYHIDGLVLGGKFIHCWPSKYFNDCLAFHDGKYLGSYLLAPQNPLTERLRNEVISILQILPTPANTTFHAEIFHTPQDELITCEIACRTGGSRIIEEYRQAFDVDLTKLSVQAQCGLKTDVSERFLQREGPKTQFGFIGLPPKHGVFQGAPTWQELPHWVTEYNVLAKPGQSFTGAHTSVDYVLTLVVKGNTEQQVVQRIQDIAEFLENKMVWD
nr:ATP-grasp domain-containing protein [Paenactinomyces guangxiensis]